MESLGIIAPFLQPHTFSLREGGRGLITTHEIPPNDTAIQCPRTSCINKALALDTLLHNLDNKAKLREDDAIALFVYSEMTKQDKSKWHEYLKSWPSEPSRMIATLSPPDLAMLEGTTLHTVGLQWQAQIRRDYDELVASGVSSLNIPIPPYATYVTILSYMWSHCMDLPQPLGRCLVPFVDLLNHTTPDRTHTSHRYDEASDSIVIEVTHTNHKVVPAGTQLYLHYGALSNTMLMKCYGFALPRNEFDILEFYAPLSDETSCVDFAAKCVYLQHVARRDGKPHDAPYIFHFVDKTPNHNHDTMISLLTAIVVHNTPATLSQYLAVVASVLNEQQGETLLTAEFASGARGALRSALQAQYDDLSQKYEVLSEGNEDEEEGSGSTNAEDDTLAFRRSCTWYIFGQISVLQLMIAML
eukprot:PhF_6_TR32140/c0_g1_i1/m.47607